MEKSEIKFEDFLNDVNPAYMEFITQMNDYLMSSGCKIKIEAAKNGYVVSYTHTKTKRVILNYVFRKKGLIARIYADHIGKYAAFLETMPEEMKKSVEKAPVCRRLVDPVKCNSRCGMGYEFDLNENHYQKCRYNCFMLLISDENNPFIKAFIENEVKERAS